MRLADIRNLAKEAWFRQAVVAGFFALLGTWSFGLFGAEVKTWVFGAFESEFVRWGVGVAMFAVISDIFFAFVVKK